MPNVSVFTMVILIVFVIIQTGNFLLSIEKDRIGSACMWGGCVIMFAYLAKVLM